MFALATVFLFTAMVFYGTSPIVAGIFLAGIPCALLYNRVDE